MKCFYLILCFLAAVSGVDIPYNAGEFKIDGDNVYTWRSPSPYPRNNAELIVRAALGYMVQVTVKAVDIDGAFGDHLLIKSGSLLEDDRTGRLFTHHLNSERAFVSLTHDVFFLFVVNGLNEDRRLGFSVDIQRFGEPPSTTTTPPDEIIYPTPSGTDSIHITINVKGWYSQNKFSIVDDFRAVVAEMAVEYCTANNINLTEEVTIENVHINFINQCPSTWRKSEDCVRIRFSVPVFLEDDLDSYELTTENLEIMWEMLSEKYLVTIGLANYIHDDVDHKILIWLVTICLVILLFGAVIYIIRLIGNIRIKRAKKPKKLTSTYKDEKRFSGDSLGPHPLQTVPNLFEQYALYEPQLSPTPRYASGVSEADVNLQQFTFPNEERNDSSEI